MQNNTFTNKKLLVYPKLPSEHHFIIRFRGAGLANCLFIYARALILAQKYQLNILNPSWVQFNLGPYLRREKDKRHYNGLFKSFGVGNILKNWYLLSKKKYPEDTLPSSINDGLIEIKGLRNYFADLKTHSKMVNAHLLSIVSEKTLASVNTVHEDFIGVHIRLGDYSDDIRISLDWYIAQMRFIYQECKAHIPFYIFSDGSASELEKVLQIPNSKLVFFGNAIADIMVLSKAKLIIASDSTFSAWAAYLGQVPILFNKRHFGTVLDQAEYEWVYDDESKESIEQGVRKVLAEYDFN